MQRLNILAPTGFYGPWHELSGTTSYRSYRVTYETASNAPSTFEIQFQYWRGNELVTDTVTGPGTHSFGMGICVCIARVRAKSHFLPQNIEVIAHG